MNKTSIHKSAIAGMVLIMAIMFLFADMPFTKTEVVCATENNGDVVFGVESAADSHCSSRYS